MDIQELMKLMNSDPSQEERMKMLAQMMAQQRDATQQEQTADRHTPEDYEKLRQQVQQLSGYTKRLRQANKVLMENIDILISRNDQLADALGACRDCFGEDPHCKTCRGLGKPGYFEVDPRLFAIYVQPCLAKEENY